VNRIAAEAGLKARFDRAHQTRARDGDDVQIISEPGPQPGGTAGRGAGRRDDKAIRRALPRQNAITQAGIEIAKGGERCIRAQRKPDICPGPHKRHINIRRPGRNGCAGPDHALIPQNIPPNGRQNATVRRTAPARLLSFYDVKPPNADEMNSPLKLN
jgi:hypothetical protein